MPFTPNTPKQRILHRLKIARGHLEKVISMVESDTYCIDILHQSNAVQKALKQTDEVILEQHLNTCVIESIQQGKKEEAIREVMQIFTKGA